MKKWICRKDIDTSLVVGVGSITGQGNKTSPCCMLCSMAKKDNNHLENNSKINSRKDIE